VNIIGIIIIILLVVFGGMHAIAAALEAYCDYQYAQLAKEMVKYFQTFGEGV
jgi:Na+(H+)/acetate symporter ActP